MISFFKKYDLVYNSFEHKYYACVEVQLLKFDAMMWSEYQEQEHKLGSL